MMYRRKSRLMLQKRDTRHVDKKIAALSLSLSQSLSLSLNNRKTFTLVGSTSSDHPSMYWFISLFLLDCMSSIGLIMMEKKRFRVSPYDVITFTFD